MGRHTQLGYLEPGTYVLWQGQYVEKVVECEYRYGIWEYRIANPQGRVRWCISGTLEVVA
jgi:hypothetical protein